MKGGGRGVSPLRSFLLSHFLAFWFEGQSASERMTRKRTSNETQGQTHDERQGKAHGFMLARSPCFFVCGRLWGSRRGFDRKKEKSSMWGMKDAVD